jgi:hypothetical protein
MFKKTLYPKTQRISHDSGITITEKLDGSNLGIFKMDDELWIATRKNIFALSEIEDVKQVLYNGMYPWLKENGETLLNNLHNDSGFFGEWIGMGKIKYPNLDKKIYMFAKANITSDFEIINLVYDHKNFIYPFDDQIPEFLGKVPIVVDGLTELPSIESLNNLYDYYCDIEKRNIEGFIIIYNNKIKKYVRMKNGKLTEHEES